MAVHNTSEGTNAPLPGAVGVSRLQVYDTQTCDGLVGGSPHVHLACTEGYVVIGGEGSVQTLSAAGFQETPLRRGTVAWFTPGVIHRLVNADGQLEIVVMMENAGLPEAGDAVFTFPDEVLADRAEYWAAAAVGAGPVTVPAVRDAVARRRDLAVEGFQTLRRRVDDEGPAALRDFYAAAGRLVRDKVPDWRQRWEHTVLRATEQTARQLTSIEADDLDYLLDAQVQHFDGPTASDRPGMCGALSVYVSPAPDSVR